MTLREKDGFLDLGCGESGDLVRHALASQCQRVLAIDVDIKRLRTSNEWTSHAIDVIRASGTHLPIKNETFDKIAMTEVLEHLPSGTEIESLSEIYRVLREGGRLFLSTPNKKPIFMMLDPAIARGHRHYSPSELRSNITRSRLKILNIQTYGGFGEAILTPIFYLLRKLRLCGHEMPQPMLYSVDREYRLPRGAGYTVVVECAK